jgi:vitamin B12/bleomycin/antimicrobial peptide transport system ATP-binding/permease protein
MVHVRDNAESIAFYRGENLELQNVEGRFVPAISNSNLLIIWIALLDIFQYAYRYFARLVPYLIVAPLYFAKQVDFGTIGQGIFAFQMVLSALSIIPTRIQDISSFAASIERLGTLYERFRQRETKDFVSHRPRLVDYHQTVLDLRPDRDRSWQLLAAEDYRFAS